MTRTLNLPNNDRLAYLAALIAVEVPLRANQFAVSAYVRWSLIHEIRAELEAGGFDWRKTRAAAEASQKARQELNAV